MLDEHTLGLADYAGNRQYITLGNLADNDRAYLFLLDFAGRRRIKVWGQARAVEDDPHCWRGSRPGLSRATRTRHTVQIEAWDVNCSQHITSRFSEAEIAEATVVLRDRISATWNAENARLRGAAASDHA